MSNNEILERLKTEKYIYGYSYGEPYIHCDGMNGEYWKKDKLEKIPISNLKIGKYNDCLIYIWGGPGPDCNIYEFSNYGITWAFDKKDIKDITFENHLERMSVDFNNFMDKYKIIETRGKIYKIEERK